MVLKHQQQIYSSILENGSMLEWGSGGTSVWLAKTLAPSQRLVSVEHHEGWSQQVEEATREFSNYTMRHCPPSVDAELGKNATCWEENPSALDAYINQPDIEDYDVFLVDGVARGACLMTLFARAKSGARVFLHDAHRTWYQWALRSPRITDAVLMDGGMMKNYPDCKAADLWHCVLK